MASKEVILNINTSVIPTVPFWRPDSVAILSDKDALMRLNRYWRILSRIAIAKYLVAKKFSVDEYDKDDESSMWKIHREAMKEFHEFFEMKKEDEILRWYEERETPEYSLLRLRET